MSFTAYAIHYVFATVCALVAIKHIVLADVFHLRWWTLLAMRAFFALTAAAQIVIIVDDDSQGAIETWLSAASVVALVVMIAGILFDQKRAVNRMANALDALRDRYDGLAVVPGERGQQMIKESQAQPLNCGAVVAATVNAALLAPDERPGSVEP
jgi:hypothetical protein